MGPPGEPTWPPSSRTSAASSSTTRCYVDFLTAGEYTAETTSEDDERAADDERAELDRYAGELRALGVASGELDLFEAFNQVSDGGTLAFYDPATSGSGCAARR